MIGMSCLLIFTSSIYLFICLLLWSHLRDWSESESEEFSASSSEDMTGEADSDDDYDANN